MSNFQLETGQCEVLQIQQALGLLVVTNTEEQSPEYQILNPYIVIVSEDLPFHLGYDIVH